LGQHKGRHDGDREPGPVPGPRTVLHGSSKPPRMRLVNDAPESGGRIAPPERDGLFTAVRPRGYHVSEGAACQPSSGSSLAEGAVHPKMPPWARIISSADSWNAARRRRAGAPGDGKVATGTGYDVGLRRHEVGLIAVSGVGRGGSGEYPLKGGRARLSRRKRRVTACHAELCITMRHYSTFMQCHPPRHLEIGELKMRFRADYTPIRPRRVVSAQERAYLQMHIHASPKMSHSDAKTLGRHPFRDITGSCGSSLVRGAWRTLRFVEDRGRQ
jgi:hypothetical protein